MNCLYVSLDVMGTLGCLELRFLHQNTIFCISGLMNARLSVHCTLKHAKHRNSGPVRLQARLSVLVSELHAYRHA